MVGVSVSLSPSVSPCTSHRRFRPELGGGLPLSPTLLGVQNGGGRGQMSLFLQLFPGEVRSSWQIKQIAFALKASGIQKEKQNQTPPPTAFQVISEFQRIL